MYNERNKMKKINDSSFEKIFSLKKYRDLFDFSTLECKIAFFAVLIFNFIFVIYMHYEGKNNFINECVSLLDELGIALIGFLGFIVTGLAILTGAISSKVVKKLQNRNKMKALEKILLSFYLVALVDAFVILAIFLVHFISRLPVDSIYGINLLISSLFVYLIIFSIFYSVKLIGNCIELFYIINEMEIVQESAVDYKIKYNGYRLLALEKLILSETSLGKIYEYKTTLEKIINDDQVVNEERQVYYDMLKKQFGE